MVERITLLGGCGKSGQREPVARVDLNMGQVVSIVGPTGSGKTTLFNDIELFADGSTPTKRRVLINDRPPGPEYRDDPSRNPIALITQHTNFLSDLPVREFLAIHAEIRRSDDDAAEAVVGRTLAFANQLTGEAVLQHYRMTELSGGQTRALLIADAVIIGNAPIVLLDEIENAGIHRMRALELLRRYRKIFVFVTHDPYIPLLSDFRIVMANGAMTKVIHSGDAERKLAQHVRAADDLLSHFRERIRSGGRFSADELEALA
ncbi:MAG: ATP-binding cassette domain-containing protein [Phycisphaerae bacterium]|nr:ATP-binding cassette domain-containing protein [Phycisphaerae bacterium]HQL54174.1 ATP-binding cassette domain-containing protein [Phycisphaerae bacterium]